MMAAAHSLRENNLPGMMYTWSSRGIVFQPT